MLALLTLVSASLTNEEFLSQVHFSKAFGLDDTQELEKLRGELVALPSLFGYSEKDGNELFPPYFYPRCESRARRNDSVKLDFTTNTVEVKCKGNYPGSFILGPVKEVKVSNPTEARKYWNVVEYTGSPMPIKPYHEFVLMTCDNPSSSVFNNLDLKPRLLEKSYKSVLSQLPSHQKPMIILLVTVDSFSRRHFYRKLPATVEYLNGINSAGKYAVFDFKFHNIIGSDTSENMMRIFGKKWVRDFKGDQETDFHGDQAIWTLLKKNGFMTLFGTDACNHNVPKSMGKSPKVDHAVSLFYCANYAYNNYAASKQRAMSQRCLGGHMSHWWLMEYALQFSRQYNRANQWLFTHFAAAHEMTGQHAATLNEDLKNWLESYYKEFGESHEIVVLLHGDHGMRYGEFLSAEESIQEHRLPAFFVIARHEFLKKHEFSYDTLWQNTQRLTTKPDLRETILELGAIASNSKYVKNQEGFYSLLSETVPFDRTCIDASIPIWYCSTYVPRLQPGRLYKPEDRHSLNSTELEISNLIKELSERVILRMNEDVFTSTVIKAGHLCMKLSIKEVTTVAYAEVSETAHIFRIMLKIDQEPRAEVDAWLVLTNDPVNEQDMKHENYLYEPITYRGKKIFARILTIIRVDKYGGECENLARSLKLNPQYCICRPDAKDIMKTVWRGWC